MIYVNPQKEMTFKLASLIILLLFCSSYQDKIVQDSLSTSKFSNINKCDLIVLAPRGYESIDFKRTESAIVLMEFAFKHELSKVSAALYFRYSK